MLIPFPLGLLATAVVFDIIWLITDRPAFTPAAAFAGGAFRLDRLCSFVAVVVAVGTAWLGGELVERLGIGVDEGANTDAPSSLSHKHVTA